MHEINDNEALECTQKLLILLFNLYKNGRLPQETLFEHTKIKISYLLQCCARPDLAEYKKTSINILNCYRNILQQNSVPYKI
jgi:hypothetical protein